MMTNFEDENRQSQPTDDELSENNVTQPAEHDNSGAPEPPVRWRPDTSMQDERMPSCEIPSSMPDRTAGVGKTRVQLKGEEIAEFESARRMITVSQVIAVVSLFLGGVLLSCVAIVCAVMGYRRLNHIALAHSDNESVQKAFRRSGILAICVAAFTLVINIVSLVFFYPMVMDMLQTGDFGSLIGGGSSSGTGAGNSTWG